MTENMRNMLVGVFVISALGVLAILMAWFGETPSWMGGSEWTLRITGVDELRGISDGSPVNMNGVEIGRVKTLEFENANRPDRGVVVVTRIKKQYVVPRAAFAKVYGATLGFGTGHVEICMPPGASAEPVDTENAMISGEMHNIIGEIISKELVSSFEQTVMHIGNLADSATPVAQSLSTLLEPRSLEQTDQPGGVTPNLATVVERFDVFLANINAVLGDKTMQGDLKVAVGALKDATESLKQTIVLWRDESRRISDNVNSGIDRTEENFDQSFVKLNKVLDRLDGAATNLDNILHEVKEGRGTAGLLVHDERLYEAAVISLERFAELIASLQHITGKIEEDGYITIAQKTPVGTFTKNFPIGGGVNQRQAANAP